MKNFLAYPRKAYFLPGGLLSLNPDLGPVAEECVMCNTRRGISYNGAREKKADQCDACGKSSQFVELFYEEDGSVVAEAVAGAIDARDEKVVDAPGRVPICPTCEAHAREGLTVTELDGEKRVHCGCVDRTLLVARKLVAKSLMGFIGKRNSFLRRLAIVEVLKGDLEALEGEVENEKTEPEAETVCEGCPATKGVVFYPDVNMNLCEDCAVEEGVIGLDNDDNEEENEQ